MLYPIWDVPNKSYFSQIRTTWLQETIKYWSWFGYRKIHCVKSVRIRSYSGPHFPAFGLNTERHSASVRFQSECGKMRIRITPNRNTFYAVIGSNRLRGRYCHIFNTLRFLFLKDTFQVLSNWFVPIG